MKRRFHPGPRVALGLLFAALVAGRAEVGFAAPGGEEPGAASERDREEAKAHFLAGSQSFSRGNFRQAIVQFRKAFDLVRSPEILFNIGRCHEELGEFEEAIYHYEMYLRFFPQAEDSESVRARIASLKEKQAALAGGPADKAAAAEPGAAAGGEAGKARADRKGGTGIRLGLGVGVGGGASGPSEGAVVPIELGVGIPVIGWLQVTAAFRYGHYFADTSDKRRSGTSAYYSQNQVGGIVGLRGDWPVLGILSLTARLGFSALWIDFGHNEGKTSLAGRVEGGMVLDITEHWALFADLWISAGAMVGKEIANTPMADHTPETEIGFIVGAEYVF